MEKMITKPIRNFPDYKVSKCGQILNKNGKILKGDKSNGYRRVTLYKNGTKCRHFVHLLTLWHFKSLPKRLRGVSNVIGNHKDHDKMNNHISNLEYETQSGNIYKYHQHRVKRKIRINNGK